jgi:activator of 2-hydroxyglutaryl-CoA dehydratase
VLDSSEALLGGLVRVGELSAERLVSELASGEAEILVPSFEVALGKSENWPSPKAWL